MKEIAPGLWDIDEIGTMVHAYAWVWEDQISLVDTGMPGNADKILTALTDAGFDATQVSAIVVTHMDVDHAGSLRALVRKTGASVICHAVEKVLLENPGRRRPARSPVGMLVRPLHALLGFLPFLRVEPTVPDQLVVDGHELPGGLVVVHTPGHTPGHISLYHAEQHLLIAGDALTHFNARLAGPPPLFTSDPDAAQRSIWKLAKRFAPEIDTVVFGHGPPILSSGGQAIEKLAASLFPET